MGTWTISEKEIAEYLNTPRKQHFTKLIKDAVAEVEKPLNIPFTIKYDKQVKKQNR